MGPCPVRRAIPPATAPVRPIRAGLAVRASPAIRRGPPVSPGSSNRCVRAARSGSALAARSPVTGLAIICPVPDDGPDSGASDGCGIRPLRRGAGRPARAGRAGVLHRGADRGPGGHADQPARQPCPSVGASVRRDENGTPSRLVPDVPAPGRVAFPRPRRRSSRGWRPRVRKPPGILVVRQPGHYLPHGRLAPRHGRVRSPRPLRGAHVASP